MSVAAYIRAKKDICLRICVAYRRLNAVTETDSYLISGTDLCIDSWRRAQLFSTLNASSAYQQIEIDNQVVDKTVVVAYHGLYKYTGIPLGLKNALATFQKAVDVIIASV